MSPGDEIAPGPTYGAVRALLEFAWDRLAGVAERLGNRDLAFINDPETIQRVKQKRRAAEYELLRKFVRDNDLWPLVASGLVLRDLEDRPESRARRDKLRDAIHGAHEKLE
jgi:hypothetical protein